jgi:hypothetical protein
MGNHREHLLLISIVATRARALSHDAHIVVVESELALNDTLLQPFTVLG